MLPDSLWIMPDTILAFFDWVFSAITGFLSFLFGVGRPVFTFFGVGIYTLDILLIILLTGVVMFYVTFSEKLDAVNAKRKARIADMYIRPGLVEAKNKRWENISYMIRTPNPADWRIAIIDADSMLDELLIRLGYPGATLGERLKSANKANFPTLDDAWEAHKVRNQIAHAGGGFILDQREALRVYYLYERVFRDSGYV